MERSLYNHILTNPMIYQSMSLLKEELTAFIQSLGSQETEPVLLGNIGLLETDEGKDLKEAIVMSLVNVEEESALKNMQRVARTEGDKIVYENPSVFLNLYLLFTANWPENYDNAIKRLSTVIKFFQWRSTFTLDNSTVFAAKANLDDPDLQQFKLVADMYTLTFEQINHLWGSLGGKQIPFVMYKVRLIKEKHRQPVRSGPPVEQINASEEIN